MACSAWLLLFLGACQLPVFGAPAGDDLAMAASLGGYPGYPGDIGVSSFAADGATFEAWEPALPLPPGEWSGSLWFSWTPSADNVYRFYNSPVSNVQIFSGTFPGNLTPVPVSDGFFHLAGGQSYRFRFLTTAADISGTIKFFTLSGFLPVGDAIGSFLPITWPAAGTASSAFQSTIGATAEPGEPSHGGLPATYSVWWGFTATETAVFAVNLPSWPPPPPTRSLAVYRGTTMDSLVEIFPSGSPSVYAMEAGQSYRIVINDTGDYFGYASLMISRLTPVRVPNDDFSQRAAVTLYHYVNPTQNFSEWPWGSREAGEPAFPPAAGAAAASAWWEFTPAASGWFELYRDSGAAFEVFTGTALENLQLLVPSSAAYSSYSGGEFHRLTAGQPVMIRVAFVPGRLPRFAIGPAEAYQSFVLNAGLAPAQQLYEDNPSGDGISNLQKFIYGLDPAKTLAADSRRDRYPHIEPAPGGRVDFVYSIDADARGYLLDSYDNVYVRTAVSADLSHWDYLPWWGSTGSYPVPHEWIDTEEDPAYPDDQVRIRFPLESRRFFRAQLVLDRGSSD